MQLHLPTVLDELAKLDARLLIASFAPLSRFAEWAPYFRESFLQPFYTEHHLSLPDNVFARTRFLADPALDVYHAYGLGRLSMLQAYGPKIIWQYLRWAAMGKPIKRTNQDTLQRGGDFVINREGRLTLAHMGNSQAERPPVSEILAALRK